MKLRCVHCFGEDYPFAEYIFDGKSLCSNHFLEAVEYQSALKDQVQIYPNVLLEHGND